MNCYRHTKVETFVSCGGCGRPICPKCMISGPVGMRCRDCASLRSTSLYKIAPGRLILAIVGGLIVGAIGAQVVSMASFFSLFIAPIYGGIVAEVVLRASGHKRGTILEVVAVGSIVLGFVPHAIMYIMAAIASAGAVAAHAVPPSAGLWYGLGLASGIWDLVGCCLAVGACLTRIRYI